MRHAAPRLLIMLVALAVGLLLRFMAASKETPLSVSGTADPSSALSLAVEGDAPVVDETAPAAGEEPIRRVTIRL